MQIILMSIIITLSVSVRWLKQLDVPVILKKNENLSTNRKTAKSSAKMPISDTAVHFEVCY